MNQYQKSLSSSTRYSRIIQAHKKEYCWYPCHMLIRKNQHQNVLKNRKIKTSYTKTISYIQQAIAVSISSTFCNTFFCTSVSQKVLSALAGWSFLLTLSLKVQEQHIMTDAPPDTATLNQIILSFEIFKYYLNFL